MKKCRLLFIAISTLLFASCASDNDVTSGGNEAESGVTATVAPIEYDEFTRSSMSYDATKGMVFKWSSEDRLTVLPDADDDYARNIYVLKRGAESSSARFSCESFQLKTNTRYFALGKDEAQSSNITISNRSNITVNYSGQRQIVSGTGLDATKHLGNYDFIAATGKCTVADQVYFDFKHLGIFMFITMQGLPAGGKYKRLDIYDSKNIYRQPVRTINLSNGVDPSDDSKYAPAFNPENIESETYKQSPRFSLFLGPDTNENGDNNDDEGLTVPSGANASDRKLELFFTLPPVDMTDNTFIFSLVPADNATKPYYLKWESKKEHKAGKSYRYTGIAEEVSTFEVNLKVNHDWQLGKTRATTGDPGIEDHFEKPKYIYYVYFVEGQIKEINDGAYFGHVDNIDESKWLRSADKVMDTYSDENHKFIFSLTDDEKTQDQSSPLSKNVYFVASMEPIEAFSTSNITSTTTEEQIRALLYSIPAKGGEESDADYQLRSQTFLKNLYSTPWTTQATFVGSLKDPYQDVILYHTAAKVDLKWNSPDKLSGSVLINNVKNTELSLFQPTTTTYAIGTYSVTSTIDMDRMYNGRQVFYLPQFADPNCTYNVKVGGKDAENVTFSPATTNGFTSWLRWLRQY